MTTNTEVKKIVVQFEAVPANQDHDWQIVATCYENTTWFTNELCEYPYIIMEGTQDEIACGGPNNFSWYKPRVKKWVQEQYPNAEIEFSY